MDDLSDVIDLLQSGTYQVTRTPPLPFVGGLAVQAVSASAWATGRAYAAAARVSHGGQAYVTASGGTSGATAPTGTSASVSDGGVTWAWLGPALETLTIVASVQPVSGRELERLSELYRAKEAQVLFTKTELRTADASGAPDIVTIRGEPWQVSNVQRWAELGNFYKATVTLAAR